MPKSVRTPKLFLRLYSAILLGLCGLVSVAWLTYRPPLKSGRPRASVARSSRQTLRNVTVILDPGHGGSDSGYRRRDCREDSLSYRFVATLAAVLRKQGANVILTVRSQALEIPLQEGRREPPLLIPTDAVLTFNGKRVGGNLASLYGRAATARNCWKKLSETQRRSGRGIYFLSLHHDADAVRRVRGAHVLYDRRAGGPPRFAAVLSSHLFKAGIARRRTNGGLLASDARGLAVLNPKYNPVPQRVLLEIAVLSNPEDRTLALSRQWRWQAAHRIAEAIFACENGEGAH